MATTELLLLTPIEDLGNEGDQVNVKAGYARNYLLPRKLAVPVTRANRKQVEVLQKRRDERLRKELEAATAIKEKIEKVSVAIAVKTGPGGKVFGAVTAQNLIERLADEGIALEKKQVSLYTPAKSLGKHTTRIRLHEDISVDFEFEIVSENPIEEEGAEAENA
ncbi:MAG: 50S ribosomal protein L9 [Opitutales bacterium]|nr:50S ribosomal protein L9 [Opitutales bacterium]